MSRGFCSPEERAVCPLSKHFSDLHHTQYPASQYNTKVEKAWRELPINKVQLCRALHDAIHSTGYIPEKPSRDDMLAEIWNNGEVASLRAATERHYQIQLGQAALGGIDEEVR